MKILLSFSVFFLVNGVFAQTPSHFLDLKNRSKVFETNGIVWVYSPAVLKTNSKALGTIIISPGRTEAWFNWYEYIYEMNERSYDIFLIEHRGQGRSSRFILNSDIGHIDRFKTYVEDFNHFLNEVKKLKPTEPVFAVGNSMGASIIMLSDVSSFKKIVLHSPMFDIQTGLLPRWFSKLAITFIDFLGFGEAYVPGSGPFETQDFKENIYASSKRRFTQNLNLNIHFKEQVVGGPSIRWAKEAFRVFELVEKRIHSIDQPVLILQADDERVVNNKVHQDICKPMKSCAIQKIENSKHVLHLEDDSNFNKVIEKTLQFFQSEN